MAIQKTALVTGGAARVGKAICEGLADAGYNIALHYNSSAEKAEAVVQELREKGISAAAVQADLSNMKDTATVIEKATSELGPLGILVNNASLFEEDDFNIPEDELWDKHFAVHVKTPALLTSGFVEQVSKDANGLVVNIIDERVWKLTPNFASYTLSKSTLWTATKTMAQRYAPKVRVNAIGPGPTLPSYRQTEAQFAKQLDTLLLKTNPALPDFAKTILYLADMRAVTGQMIALDGGQHLGWQTPDQSVPE